MKRPAVGGTMREGADMVGNRQKSACGMCSVPVTDARIAVKQSIDVEKGRLYMVSREMAQGFSRQVLDERREEWIYGFVGPVEVDK